MIEDFDKLKNAFFAEVKSFKDKVLDSFENVVGSPTDVSKTFTAHILEEVHFLRKQLKSKDEMINSLLNQLPNVLTCCSFKKATNHHHHRHLLYHRHHYHHHHHHRCCHHHHHHYHHHHHLYQIQIFYQHQKK